MDSDEFEIEEDSGEEPEVIMAQEDYKKEAKEKSKEIRCGLFPVFSRGAIYFFLTFFRCFR